jgi:hypothetical protein
MKNITPIFLAVLLLTFLSCSKESNESTTAETEEITTYTLEFAQPEEVGLDADSLSKIDEIIMKYVDNGRFPGGGPGG